MPPQQGQRLPDLLDLLFHLGTHRSLLKRQGRGRPGGCCTARDKPGDDDI